MRDEQSYKEQIAAHMTMTLAPSDIPELGTVHHGKVRDVYIQDETVVMISSDNLSTFDYVMANLIPYKGIILNKFATWAFASVQDILPSAMLDSPDPNVVVQKKLKNIGLEAVVRGYMRGRLAVAYEEGERDFCGICLPDGLLSYEQLATPLFTPTTKYEASDRNLTQSDIEALLGKTLADLVQQKALALYARGAELAKQRGFILIDTKYEFGTDEAGNLYLIDEMHTPDSSRYCTIEERESKFPRIQKEMATGKRNNVSALLVDHPELKLKEYSKQYIRDVVAEGGVTYKDGKIVAETFPILTDEQVIEMVYRYISTYEDLTGEVFDFSVLDGDPKQRLLGNLKKTGYIQ